MDSQQEDRNTPKSATVAELSAEQLERLTDTARRLGVTPEMLLRMAIADLLAEVAQPSFEEALDYVFSKNAELYRRLA